MVEYPEALLGYSKTNRAHPEADTRRESGKPFSQAGSYDGEQAGRCRTSLCLTSINK